MRKNESGECMGNRSGEYVACGRANGMIGQTIMRKRGRGMVET